MTAWEPGDAGAQLRGWTAATYRTASRDVTMRSTVIAVAVLERAPSWPRLRTRLVALSRSVPALRMRPARGALGMGTPRLVWDVDFDIDVHVRRYRLPIGGGWPDVLEDARRMSLTDFDAHRPLWEAVLIEGLPDGEAAFLLKLHHSIADGQATVLMALTLFDLSADADADRNADADPSAGDPRLVASGPSAPAHGSEHEPGTTSPVGLEPPAIEPEIDRPAVRDVGSVEVMLADLTDNARRGVEFAGAAARTCLGFLRASARDPIGTWTSTAATVASTLASIGRVTEFPDGPLSSVLRGRGTTYHFATFDFPFAALRSAAKTHGMSVNDAYLAAISEGMDAYHRRHGTPVPALRVNVPVSLRGDPGDRSGSAANAVGIARFPLPIGGLTSTERMQAAHELVGRWRAEPALRMADPLAEISWFVPVPMLAAAARASDVTASNVPGPPVPLYLCGARMVAAYPLVATIGAAVSITMVTYDGGAFIGITADDRAVRDLAALVHDLRAGFAAITGEWPGPADRGPAS